MRDCVESENLRDSVVDIGTLNVSGAGESGVWLRELNNVTIILAHLNLIELDEHGFIVFDSDKVDEPLSAGRYDAVWDGLDTHARPVPSGLYITRLRAGEHLAQQKMLRIR